MELRVWVDGTQRVVCGITEQTTVQEVVIALAQATGRTGRYTLVERWRNAERLLPPSETPLTVLNKWGTYAADVMFILRRSATSDGPKNNPAPVSQGPPSSSASSGFDKNQQIRQSLPTHSKARPLFSAADKSRKSLGPGHRTRGESSSSLPVTQGASGNIHRSGSPQRAPRTPSRPPVSGQMRAPSANRQPSPNRLNHQRRLEIQHVITEQQMLLKDHTEHIDRIERKIQEVLKRDGNRKDEEHRLLEQIRQNDARISSEQDKRNSKIALEREVRAKKDELAAVQDKIRQEERKAIETQRLIDELSRSTRLAKERESDELRRVEYDNQREAHRLQEKMHRIEELNRELRKVTVLPSQNAEPFHRKENSTSSQGSSIPNLSPPKPAQGNSGVWV
ncbi:Oidioi.mRNA.OKI2018_I69.chr1.g3451.t1.cds [Oikopleura dioica]|uniref:Oidioi.mRNA.OKI2018_I69.chr1.g3451.t1.cds n=1 Tax=Oikopleura dioica TaxID=34765 RepID=A0ABN7SZM6_OIKDI|nr:Oidioi.mRNA.OKI2018_I69.chr1.g3451.t1.cds [Oikopleura dioica]